MNPNQDKYAKNMHGDHSLCVKASANMLDGTCGSKSEEYMNICDLNILIE